MVGLDFFTLSTIKLFLLNLTELNSSLLFY